MKILRLSTQAAIISVGRFVNVAVAAGTMVVLARTLPDKESYGAINQLIMLYMMLSQIFSVGLPQSTYFFLPRYEGGERRGFIVQTIVLLMLSGLALGAGFYFGAEPLGHALGNRMLPELLRIFAVYPLLMLPTMAVEGTLLHAGRPMATVMFNTIVRLGMFLALVIPSFFHASLPVTLKFWIASSAIMWIAALELMLSTVRGLPLRWNRAMLKEEWAFSLPLAGVMVIAIMASYMSRLYVSHNFGPVAFGIYANGTIDIPTVTMVFNAVSAVLTAEFSRRTSRGDALDLMPLWHSAIKKLTIVIFASMGFLVFWAHETMVLLFSARYAESGVIFAIAVWGIPLRLLATQPLFVAMGATRPFAIQALINLVCQVIGISIGGHYLGLPGVVIGSLCAGYIAAIIGTHWFLHRITTIGWRAFLPWRQVIAVLLLALAIGALCRGVHWLAMRQWPMLISYLVSLLLFVIVYLVTLERLHLLGDILPASWLQRLRIRRIDENPESSVR